MSKRVNKQTAMVIVEPILGEAGVVVPPTGYLRGLREICDRSGALMVLDCVQTGMGRTGVWFGYEKEGILPDVITLSKGLGGGLPLGAMIALGKAADLFVPGDHGSTFGGNPVCCASALATIKVIEEENILADVIKRSILLKDSISEINGVKEVRGEGLLLGIVLKKNVATEVKQALEDLGVLVNAPSKNVIRIAPPLNVSLAHTKSFIAAFSLAMKEI
jgi:acetylornithine aminotransferase